MAKTVSLTLPLTRAGPRRPPGRRRGAALGPRLHHARLPATSAPCNAWKTPATSPSIWKVPPSSTRDPPRLRPGAPLGSVGPTTASRMDFATPALFEAGIVAAIGKGKRSPEVVRSCQETGSVYLCTVGGIAALLAKSVTESELVGWEDLGTEALRKLTLKDFPTYVAVDTKGGDLYREIEAAAQ